MTIKYKGYRVNPIQIESVIIKMEGVKEVVAFGGECDEYGEKIIAIIVCEEKKELIEKELIKYCSIYLEKEILPQKVIYNSLPKSLNGKIDRKKLKKSI